MTIATRLEPSHPAAATGVSAGTTGEGVGVFTGVGVYADVGTWIGVG